MLIVEFGSGGKEAPISDIAGGGGKSPLPGPSRSGGGGRPILGFVFLLDKVDSLLELTRGANGSGRPVSICESSLASFLGVAAYFFFDGMFSFWSVKSFDLLILFLSVWDLINGFGSVPELFVLLKYSVIALAIIPISISIANLAFILCQEPCEYIYMISHLSLAPSIDFGYYCSNMP